MPKANANGKVEHKFIDLKDLKVSDDSPGTIEGYRSVFSEIDEGGDLVVKGAFADCIPEYLHSGFTAHSHDWSFSEAVGFPIAAIEDDYGWKVTSQFHGTPDAQNIRQKAKERMDAGKQVGFSFGYKADEFQFIEQKDFKDQLPHFIKPDRLEENMRKAQKFSRIRILKKVSAVEDSLVTVGMNRMAAATSVKSGGGEQPPEPTVMTKEELEALRKAVGAIDLPLAPLDHVWDSSATEKAVREFCKASDAPNADYAKSFLYVAEDGGDKFGDYALAFGLPLDGKMVAVPKRIIATAERVDAMEISDEAKTAIRVKLDGYFAKMRSQFKNESLVAPWKAKAITEDLATSVAKLKEIIAIHEGHMQAKEYDEETAQEEMDLLDQALALLSESDGMGGSKAAKGGSGSGNFGHEGVPGQFGGSAPGGGGGGSSPGYASAHDEFRAVDHRLAVGGLKRGERAMLERRRERLAKLVLEDPTRKGAASAKSISTQMSVMEACQACIDECLKCIKQCDACPNKDAAHLACIQACKDCLTECTQCMSDCGGSASDAAVMASCQKCSASCMACVEMLEECATSCSLCKDTCQTCSETCGACSELCDASTGADAIAIKGFRFKAGARNSASDKKKLQQIHDNAASMESSVCSGAKGIVVSDQVKGMYEDALAEMTTPSIWQVYYAYLEVLDMIEDLPVSVGDVTVDKPALIEEALQALVTAMREASLAKLEEPDVEYVFYGAAPESFKTLSSDLVSEPFDVHSLAVVSAVREIATRSSAIKEAVNVLTDRAKEKQEFRGTADGRPVSALARARKADLDKGLKTASENIALAAEKSESLSLTEPEEDLSRAMRAQQLRSERLRLNAPA